MRLHAAVASALLLSCSSDGPTGQPAGLSAGGSPAAPGGAPSATAAGKAGDGGATASAGATGQPGGSGGLGGPVAGGSAGASGSAAVGAGGEPAGGQAGQSAGGGPSGAGGVTASPVELGCAYQGECIDGRDEFVCPGGALPGGCVEYHEGSGAKPISCCGAPKPAACKPANVAGATRATATVADGKITVALQPGAVAWIASPSETGSGKTPGIAGVFASASPIAAGSVEVCFGYACSDGGDGVGACTVGQEVKADGLTLCCLASDFGASGAAPKASLVCPNEGARTSFIRLTSSASVCVDAINPSVLWFL